MTGQSDDYDAATCSRCGHPNLDHYRDFCHHYSTEASMCGCRVIPPGTSHSDENDDFKRGYEACLRAVGDGSQRVVVAPPTERECSPCSCAKDDEPHCACSDVHYSPAKGADDA